MKIKHQFQLVQNSNFKKKIDGSHKDISSIMSFAQDKEASGYKRIDLSLGINHVFHNLKI